MEITRDGDVNISISIAEAKKIRQDLGDIEPARINVETSAFRDMLQDFLDEIDENIVTCPVCDHIISDIYEGVSDPCEHVMLTYVDICGGEFVYVGVGKGGEKIEEELMGKYGEMMEDDYEGEDLSLSELMEAYAYKHKGYEVIELTTSGLSCGPCSSTEYHLIKMK